MSNQTPPSKFQKERDRALAITQTKIAINRAIPAGEDLTVILAALLGLCQEMNRLIVESLDSEPAPSQPNPDGFALGDCCPICETMLIYEKGSPQTYHEPETPPEMYCIKCGEGFQVDFSRMEKTI